MVALSFAMTLAVLDIGPFFTAALAAGFATLAEAVTFLEVAAAFDVIFFAVAIFKFPFLFNWLRCFTSTVLSPVFASMLATMRLRCRAGYLQTRDAPYRPVTTGCEVPKAVSGVSN